MSWGVALRNAVGLGLGGIPSLLNAALYPRVDFNFLSGQLDPRITFTRASTGTYVNSSGVLSSAAVDAPRFDYNPTTLAPLGLLIEEQRTNLCLYSNDLNQATWGKGSTVSLTYDTTIAPDGTTTADTITVVSGTDTGVYQSIACSASTAYTWSVYVKLGTMAASDYKIAIYDNTNAAFIAVDIVPTQTPSATAWTRITYTFTTPATCVSVRPYCFRNSLSAATSVNVWGMQLEQGAFATSYVPTVAASLTRAADVASVTGANFSSWYNQSEGTLYFEGSVVGSTGADQIGLNANNNAFTERVRLGKGPTTPRFTIVDDGVVQADLTGGTWAVNAVKKLAGAYAANSIALSVDGATPLLDTVATIPTPTQLQIGNEQLATFLNGHIRSFKYYPTRLRDSALQSLTR